MSELKKRDNYLDSTKGIAIITVVLGHSFQGMSSDFDSLFGFRFIYSFHMPLFTILAGASAGFWLRNIKLSFPKAILTSVIEKIKKAFLHLIVPFLSWATINYFMQHNPIGVIDYYHRFIRSPDYGLWFLIMVFWCVVFISISTLITSLIYVKLKKISCFLCMKEYLIVIAVSYLLWEASKKHMAPHMGLTFVNDFHGGLYLYFLIGAAIFSNISNIIKKSIRIIPYIIFIPLSLYWYRTTPYNLPINNNFILEYKWLAENYAFIVALMGSLVFIDLSRVLYSLDIEYITKFLSILGKNSLAIYALHGYFLNYQPKVVAPILISLVLYLLLSKIKPIKLLLFG